MGALWCTLFHRRHYHCEMFARVLECECGKCGRKWWNELV